MSVHNTTKLFQPQGRNADRREPAAHNNSLLGSDQTDRPVLLD